MMWGPAVEWVIFIGCEPVPIAKQPIGRLGFLGRSHHLGHLGQLRRSANCVLLHFEYYV